MHNLPVTFCCHFDTHCVEAFCHQKDGQPTVPNGHRGSSGVWWHAVKGRRQHWMEMVVKGTVFLLDFNTGMGLKFAILTAAWCRCEILLDMKLCIMRKGKESLPPGKDTTLCLLSHHTLFIEIFLAVAIFSYFRDWDPTWPRASQLGSPSSHRETAHISTQLFPPQTEEPVWSHFNISSSFIWAGGFMCDGQLLIHSGFKVLRSQNLPNHVL